MYSNRPDISSFMIQTNRYYFYFLSIFWVTFFSLCFIFNAKLSFATYKLSIQRNYDTQHIRLVLDFNQQEKSVSGEATISLLPLIDNFSSFELHAKDMEIRDIMFSNETSLSFLADSETVIITLPYPFTLNDTVKIIISYHIVPTSGIYFNVPIEEKPNTPYQIYSHSEPNEARYWFPCYDEPDDKLTSEIIATVSENYFLLSNGRLLSVHNDRMQRTKTFHWLQDKPHATYLVSLVAGEYAEITEKCGNIPLYYCVYKNQVEIAPNSFEKTPKMMQFFQNIFGYKYPWDKYAQIIVADYEAAGMEHTSATTLNDRTIHDDRAHLDTNSDELVSHELAHQWFGNLVTCKNWSHIWLNEGFATYAEILFKEFDKGGAEAQYAVYEDQKFYLEMVDHKFHQPIVYENFIRPDDMFSFIEYQKAGQVLHMLKYVIGDSLFFTSLKTYLYQFAYQSVETSDFRQVVEEVSGKNLEWFFDQWLYHGGHPQFRITSKWVPETKEVLLYIHQTQQDSLGMVPRIFQMPVEVEIISSSDCISKKIFLNSREDTFKFSFNSRPQLIRFDKDNWILKEMKFIKSQDEWIYQLLNDENVAARLTALERLEQVTFDTLQTMIALEKCLVEDPFWAVREEAAYLLIDYHRSESKEVILQACHDSHPKVRAAAILALSYYYDITFNRLFRKIASQDSSYKVVAEALYALSNVPDDTSFDFVSKFVDMESHNDVIRMAAFHCLRYLKDERAIPIAIRFARDRSQPEYLRATALSILKETGIGREEVESAVIKLLTDLDNFIKKKAIDILGSFKTDRSLQALKSLQKSTLPDDVRRRLRISIEKIERGSSNN